MVKNDHMLDLFDTVLPQALTTGNKLTTCYVIHTQTPPYITQDLKRSDIFTPTDKALLLHFFAHTLQIYFCSL